MSATITDNELGLIKNTLSSQFPLTKIILFGSQATGVADRKSDVDLLVVSDFQGKRRQVMVEMNRMLDNVQHAVDILILTPKEYETEKNIPGTIAKHAVEQGRIIYERS